MAPKSGLLASSPTLMGLAECIMRYYFLTTPPGMNQDGSITLPDGKIAPGVRWARKAKRYRFELDSIVDKGTDNADV